MQKPLTELRYRPEHRVPIVDLQDIDQFRLFLSSHRLQHRHLHRESNIIHRANGELYKIERDPVPRTDRQDAFIFLRKRGVMAADRFRNEYWSRNSSSRSFESSQAAKNLRLKISDVHLNGRLPLLGLRSSIGIGEGTPTRNRPRRIQSPAIDPSTYCLINFSFVPVLQTR
ncbi:hypothetical protein VTL71DRAFT_1268 [Oculimacula yallundae]|uniref:Ribosomal protein S4 n=1 Tax=Oculimacula yallundae TaxID=86028 RepID=A0ABR4CCB6_9HELO